MPRLATTALCLSTVFLAGCQTVGELPPRVVGTASIKAGEQEIGVGRIIYSAFGGSISVALSGLSQGTYAVYIHKTGPCTAGDNVSAGENLDPANREHGGLNPAGPILGDLPAIEIGAGGVGTVSAPLAGGEADLSSWLFDEDGTAIIIHARAAASRIGPEGNGGARIACGVFQRR